MTMGDNWDDEPSSGNTYGSGIQSDEGCKFSAGRGFTAVPYQSGDDGWGVSNSKASWGEDNEFRREDRSVFRGGRGGGRGGDRRGRGGDRGDRGGDRVDRGGDRVDRGGDRGDRGGDRRGRGGRGGFRSRENGFHDDNNGEMNDNGRRGGRQFDNDDSNSKSWGGGDYSDRRKRRDNEENGNGNEDEFTNKDDDAEKKPPASTYEPQERETVEELFKSGIETGSNFFKFDNVEVNVTGVNPPSPMLSFERSGLRTHLLENVKRSCYTSLTPIQKYSIPAILAGRDLMACAQTGSGKTAAFLLPIIHRLLENNVPALTEDNSAKPNVVIMSPTRELAQQIHDQARKFAHGSPIRAEIAYGGTATRFQRDRVLRGCHILVATPGRLKDFVNRGHIAFECVQYFVLDEADRMLDMGFLGDVETVLSHATMPATGERQTLMFSATFPEDVQQLATKFLHNYIFLTVGIVGSASTDVEQEFLQVDKFEKKKRLIEILREQNPTDRTLVFVETKRTADFLATYLSEENISATSIHGDRQQVQREDALWDFKSGKRYVLVATSVAARGLDIKGVAHVINYDLPKSIDEYVHRIGRTGRVGNRGRATSFFDMKQDSALAADLSRILTQAQQSVPEWLSSGQFCSSSGDQFGGRDIRGSDFGKAAPLNSYAEVQETW